MVGIAFRRRGQVDEPEDERLLALFRNRVELKKEFAKLRNQGRQLQDKLQQQEGEALRSQQQLEQLEGMLAHPVQAVNASVFYQLRGVWNHCRRKLDRLGKNLLTQHSDRETKLELDRFNATQKAALSVISRHEQQAIGQQRKMAAELESCRREYMRARGFWNYFKRRSIAAQIEMADQGHMAATVHLEECLEQRKCKAAESPSVCQELTVEGRRKINLMLIAVTQELYLHFSKYNVSGLAREASVRQVADVNYGDITACRKLNIHIEKSQRRLPSGDDLVIRSRQRIAYLEKCAGYRLETDTVPVAGSFADIPLEVGEGGDVRGHRSVNINVLADEYWDVYSVLLT